MKEIYVITKYLKTRHESKKHGGYDIYEDDKIEISYDTYYPNRSVYVKFGSKKELVHVSSDDKTSTHRPGKWEEYITELYEKALELKKKEEARNLEKAEKEKQDHFGTIDDSKIFC